MQVRAKNLDVICMALVEVQLANTNSRRIINAVVIEYAMRLRYCVRSRQWSRWIMLHPIILSTLLSWCAGETRIIPGTEFSRATFRLLL